ncbi:MAG TPA: hypothetical protein VJW93_14520 [Candidatus Acidoferrales bacterium]|nr:hypothetical protein [Candidatus Acidoferrales bacterium]
MILMALLQRKIMRHAKNPTPQVLAASAQPQVPKKREEYLLRHLFSVMHRNAKRHHVTQNRASKFVEEADDFALDLRKSR